MKINKAVELMKYLDEIYITQLNQNRYKIGLKEYDDDFKQIVCIIDDDCVDYCLEDLYNNGCDYEQIDFGQLNKLQNFIKMLQNIGD